MEDLDDNNNDDNDDATNVAYHHNREYHQTYNDDDNDYSDDDLQDEDYEEDHTNYSASYYDDNHTHNAHNVEEERIASRSTWRSTRNNETNGTISNTATTNRKHTIRKGYQKYPKQTLPHNTHKKEEDVVDDFLPCASLDFEWMGRSLETLVFGHTSPCPILAKQRTESFTPCSKKEKGETNRHQHASSAAQPTRTTANARNGSWRGRSRINHRGYPNRTGPNIAMSLLAREVRFSYGIFYMHTGAVIACTLSVYRYHNCCSICTFGEKSLTRRISDTCTPSYFHFPFHIRVMHGYAYCCYYESNTIQPMHVYSQIIQTYYTETCAHK